MKRVFNVVDMFCGAGGESTGILQAAQKRDMKVNLLAINHWERAIETHAANHPSAEHLCESIERIDPTKAVPGNKVDLLWASPECTHHSVARGGRPRSDQSRASAWLILKWLSELYVERVIIENVPEFLSWGPLDEAGHPIKSEKGKIFQAFVNSLHSLGYSVDWRILCAADYGTPTTRRRLFVQAVKGSKKIVWPQITHMNGAENMMGYKPWIPARDIIDWSIPGTSIFNRKKPLAPATIRRIMAGIEKFWGDDGLPFLAILHGTSNAASVDDPLSTVTAGGGHHALIQPFVLPNEGYYRGNKARSIENPLPAITASRGCGGIVMPFFTRFQGGGGSEKRNHSIYEPLPSLTTKDKFALVQPLIMEYYGNGGTEPVSSPLKTVTTKDRFALLMGHQIGQAARPADQPVHTILAQGRVNLIQPVGFDITFRMLKNHELKKAQGFQGDYILKGNTTEQTKQIGNAVNPPLAEALAGAAMSA